MNQVKQLGQTLQIGECLYVLNEKNQLWRIEASANLHRPGSFVFIGSVPDRWTAEDMNKCVEAHSDAQWQSRQRERHAANHELGTTLITSRNDLDQ